MKTLIKKRMVNGKNEHFAVSLPMQSRRSSEYSKS